jgi:hypothetical protein
MHDYWNSVLEVQAIQEGRLAPCTVPVELDLDGRLEECPICFLYYPNLNESSCCVNRLCTGIALSESCRSFAFFPRVLHPRDSHPSPSQRSLQSFVSSVFFSSILHIHFRPPEP